MDESIHIPPSNCLHNTRLLDRNTPPSVLLVTECKVLTASLRASRPSLFSFQSIPVTRNVFFLIRTLKCHLSQTVFFCHPLFSTLILVMNSLSKIF